MSVRETILSEMQTIATEQNKTLGPLSDAPTAVCSFGSTACESAPTDSADPRLGVSGHVRVCGARADVRSCSHCMYIVYIVY